MDALSTGCLILFLVLIIVFLLSHLKQVLIWGIAIGIFVFVLPPNGLFWAIACGAVIAFCIGLSYYIRLFIREYKKEKEQFDEF